MKVKIKHSVTIIKFCTFYRMSVFKSFEAKEYEKNKICPYSFKYINFILGVFFYLKVETW